MSNVFRQFPQVHTRLTDKVIPQAPVIVVHLHDSSQLVNQKRLYTGDGISAATTLWKKKKVENAGRTGRAQKKSIENEKTGPICEERGKLKRQKE